MFAYISVHYRQVPLQQIAAVVAKYFAYHSHKNQIIYFCYFELFLTPIFYQIINNLFYIDTSFSLFMKFIF